MSPRTFQVAVSIIIATAVVQCRLSAAPLRLDAMCYPLLCFFAVLYLPTVLQRRSAMCRERQILAYISLSQSNLLVIGPFLCSEREITAGISLSRGRAKVSANEVTEACRKMGRLRQKRLFLTETGRFVGRLRHLERWRHPCVSGLYFQTLRVSKESCRILPSVDCRACFRPLPSEDPASFYANSPSDDFDRTISSCTRMIIRSPLPWSSTKQSPMTRCISPSPSSGAGRASTMPFIRWFSNNRQLFYVNRVQRASVYLYL